MAGEQKKTAVTINLVKLCQPCLEENGQTPDKKKKQKGKKNRKTRGAFGTGRPRGGGLGHKGWRTRWLGR